MTAPTITPVPESTIVSIRALFSDETPWDLNDIRQQLGIVSRVTVYRWFVLTKAVQSGRARVWPPQRKSITAGSKVETWLSPPVDHPPHAMILPRPDFPGTVPRWRAGTIQQWAMRVGRMRLDGTSLTPPRPGWARPAAEAVPAHDIPLDMLAEEGSGIDVSAE